jgi:hypothetical protein
MILFGFGVAPLFVLSGVGTDFLPFARAGARTLVGVGTGNGDIGGRFLNISPCGREGVIGLCASSISLSLSSISTSMISITSS